MALVCLTATGAWAQEEPLCEKAHNPQCDVVTFESLATGNPGGNFTQNNFSFKYLGPYTNGFLIDDVSYLSHGLMFSCNTSVIKLPVTHRYVTFTYVGYPATIEFLAVDSNGQVVDSEVHHNEFNQQQGQAQSVTLWGLKGRIAQVYLHHVDDATSCNFDCGEPFIGEVRACN